MCADDKLQGQAQGIIEISGRHAYDAPRIAWTMRDDFLCHER
jgi:hypothetical protein